MNWFQTKWTKSSNKQRTAASIAVVSAMIGLWSIHHDRDVFDPNNATCTTQGLINQVEALKVKDVTIINAANFRVNPIGGDYKCVADVDASDQSTKMYYSWFKGVSGDLMLKVLYTR